ncbi:MAG TPA: DUF805 domain-containing protein [Pyrinomonadaceae bacterium]|nr:DUF805 domain-containing protein [Pyrinomonadaceae bacterium]
MISQIFDIWRWHGRIGRARYFATGFVLLALKHNIDRVLAAAFGHRWNIFNYWVSDSSTDINALTQLDATFYAALVLVALPFIWIGTVLTLRRLRDADLPQWLVILFFLPFLNLIFFVILSAIPSSRSRDRQSKFSSTVSRLIPESEFGSAVLGIVATALLASLAAAFSATGLGNYGWGIFVGIPFFLGLNSSLIYGYHRPRSLLKCLLVAGLSTALVGVALFALAIEGVICLAMALPLAAVLALFGALIGFVLQQRPSFSPNTLRVVSVAFLLMPALIVLEYAAGETPPLYEVKTSVVIKSDPQTVWTHVVSFSQLSPPTETMFRTGIAYPIRADIRGQGVGAVRHCVFSTGAFVEPITVWDEPRLLRFDVTSQPRAMEELSLYGDLRPPHVENYLISRKGQFELKPLPDGTTLLEGTTWYQNRFWPAPYWHLWSDYIIHNIHKRVLLHIKSLAESQPQKGT